MKSVLNLLLAIVFLSCSSEEKVEKVEKAKLVMQIDGMSCSRNCSPLIQKKLSLTEGVESAIVDFDTQSAIIVINKNVVTEALIKTKIQSIAGGQYKVKSCKTTTIKNTETQKSSLKSTSDFDVSKPDVSSREFKLPNFFKILNIFLN